MKRVKTQLCLLLIAISLLLTHSTEADRDIGVRPLSPYGTEVTGAQWLFVIGIDTYLHWPVLNTAVNDARSIRDILLTRYYFDKKHLIELFDEQATRKNIIEKLRYLAMNVEQDDSLLIFYAGHGHLDPITKEGSWIPVEGGTKDASAWISNHDIKNYLKVDAIKAKHILLISDSCFSGDFFRGYKGRLPEVTDEVIKKAFKLSSRQAITSGGLEPVSDSGFGQNSVFSYFLLKALKENQKPFLVPSDLFTDIKAEVAQNAEQLPRFGSLADTGGQQGGELVLFLKQDSRLDASPSEAAKREKELERLQKLEADDKEAKIKEAEEIAKQERELAELDAKIEETRERLGTRTEKTDDRLNALFAMARKKKEQQTRLDELKKKRQEEEERRLAEIVQLRETRRIELISALEEDIRKYQEIASSPSGKDMKEDAWKSLVSKYPEAAKDLETGDTNRLLSNVKWANAERTFTNSIGIKFVLIPPGAFMMGSPTDEPGREDNEKQHSVTISKGYYMQATEVTQGQWRAIMGDSPSYFKDCGDDCPVEKVSWYDAQEFIKKLNDKEGTDKHRLPTEAEWEYACRAGSTTAFANGGITEKECGCDPNLDAIGWYCGNSEAQPHPVAQKKPNAWGLYDMHGNVWEWCQDWYGDYLLGNVTDPKGPLSGKHRVFRSGGWGINAEGCRSAYRLRNKPGNRYHFGGFRVTMDFD